MREPNTGSAVLITVAAGIGHITIDRPAKRNALNGETIAALTAALRTCAADHAVRAVQITGAGTSFCAGADLTEMQAQIDATESQNLAHARELSVLLSTLDSLPKPTLARVNGDGYGGALGLIAACDIVVALNSAKFAFTEVRLGIVPAVISPFVVAKIGESAARRYFLTAETLTAAHLKHLGLVHEIALPHDLDAVCGRIMDALLKGAPGALSEAKELIRDVTGRGSESRANVAADAAQRLARLRVGAEGQEGITAFFDQRKPNWRLD